MRLWNYKMLKYLPNSQLIAQYRELNSIFKNQPKHILINYVYEYPKHDLLAYSLLVMSELNARGYKFRTIKNFDEYFRRVYLIEVGNLATFVPFKNHHTDRYLLQCFYNLQEKFDRGQKDFSPDLYRKLESFVMKGDKYGKQFSKN